MAICIILLIMACQKNEKLKDIDLSNIHVESSIIRSDSIMMSLKSEAEIFEFLKNNHSVAELYFDTPEAGFKELAKKLNDFYKSPALNDFYKKAIEGPNSINVNSLQQEINTAFRHVKFYYPNFKTPKIHTLFTGFAGKDLYVSDSLIIIGLDYFAGKNAPFRPQVYDYQLLKYQKEYIVPSILNLLAVNYSKIEPTDKSMLADMIFYGKCYQFTKTMVPNTEDSLIIGYTAKQLEETEASQEIVWGHFIDQKLLYDNSLFKKAKYLEDRPNTQEISPDCPGMIGRWLGWKIVKKYAINNPSETFQSVMQKPNAQQIFELSKYKGRPDIE